MLTGSEAGEGRRKEKTMTEIVKCPKCGACDILIEFDRATVKYTRTQSAKGGVDWSNGEIVDCLNDGTVGYECPKCGHYWEV